MARILAVEDEADLRDLLKEELEAEGHEVVTASDGNDAITKLASFSPEIVISDISMPGMDGFSLLEHFREAYPALDDTPFLFLTALANREDEIRAREVGVDDYLTKPIDFDMLHSVLTTRLRQVARMRERKEQQMLKLYNTLASEKGEAVPAPQEHMAEDSQDDKTNAMVLELINSEWDATEEGPVPEAPAAGTHAPAEQDGSDIKPAEETKPRRVFGSLFKLPNLGAFERNPKTKGRNLPARALSRAVELLKRLVCEEAYIATTDDGDIVASYRDLDEDQARAKSKELNKDLQEQLVAGQTEELKEEFDLSDEMIRNALIVSESLFEVALSRDSMESQESFEASIRDVIAKTRDNPRAPNLLVTSIRNDNGQLDQLKLIARNNDPLPICFFNYDEHSKQKIRASFAFFNASNSEKASYLLDALTLDLMEDAARQIGPKDIAVVDVHFQTLASRIYAATYIRKFLHYAENTTHPFMLNIRSMPQGTSTDHLEELLRPLGKYGARRSIQISPAEIGAFAESNMPVSCIVCSYPELMACPEAKPVIAQHKQTISSAGKLLVLRGVEDASAIEDLKPLGFDGFAVDVASAE